MGTPYNILMLKLQWNGYVGYSSLLPAYCQFVKVQNIVETIRNLYQLLEGKQLYSAEIWSVHRGAT
jgi:hypothetical protein